MQIKFEGFENTQPIYHFSINAADIIPFIDGTVDVKEYTVHHFRCTRNMIRYKIIVRQLLYGPVRLCKTIQENFNQPLLDK